MFENICLHLTEEEYWDSMLKIYHNLMSKEYPEKSLDEGMVQIQALVGLVVLEERVYYEERQRKIYEIMRRKM